VALPEAKGRPWSKVPIEEGFERELNRYSNSFTYFCKCFFET
jgi:hypothetical protein